MKFPVFCKSLISYVLLAFIAFSISGCTWIVAGMMPTPGHSELVEIDPQLTNEQLSEMLLEIINENKIAFCNNVDPSINHPPSFRDCKGGISYLAGGNFQPPGWWNGPVSKVDRKAALIEIGNYPDYNDGLAGQSAQIKRLSEDEVMVTVRGNGIYYMDLPNKQAAQKIAALIEEKLQ